MTKAKILIVVEGGVIQNILTSDPNIEVAVIDYDRAAAGDLDENEEPEAIAFGYGCELFNGNWADTITEGKYGLSEKEAQAKKELAALDAESPLAGVVLGDPEEIKKAQGK